MSRTLSVGQEHELLQKLEAAGLTEQDAQKIIDSRKNELAKALIALIRGGEHVLDHVVVSDSYPLTVNRDLSLDEMIDAGCYAWRDRDIKARYFLIEGRGTTEVIAELVHFGRFIRLEKVRQEFDQRGLRPAKIEELLAFGAKYPDKQREFPIAALGSFLHDRGRDLVTCLNQERSERNLRLSWVKYGWDECWRFLAFRKSDDKKPEHIYRVTVDRDKTLKEMIEAGHYDWVATDITDKHFPIEGSGRVDIDIELVHYGHDTTTDAVLKDLDTRGLRPIRIEELIALGATKPLLQHEFQIIALGSVSPTLIGMCYCPILEMEGSERGLELNWLGRVWLAHCRFAAVRKSDQGSDSL